ncbi:universal stress protein A-like protein [Camellia sinensis]|uniref:universal stress protein A-like protein n=1 Tax=Camellia sinensis TaxID=4442 RepID=UPI001035C3EB|nr:universal stress protein A-like protein [Camellia sinensis]
MFSLDIMVALDKYNNELAESVMEKAKRLCKEVHDFDVKVETRVESGDPRDVICQATEKLGVDMVVLGSFFGVVNLNGRIFLGSVSNHCVHNAKCPVLIVKRSKSTTPNK